MKRAGPERGSLAVTFALLLILIVTLMGMAIDLALVYIRRTELQTAADAAALAAARALNGTAAGAVAAVDAATAALAGNRYAFGRAFGSAAPALAFAASADAPAGGWVAAASVTDANAAALRFARFDAGMLVEDAGAVAFPFQAGTGASLTVPMRAVAGPLATELAPLAICAMSPVRYGKRANALGAGNEELVEYGFRRGVGYNLMDLNPDGSTPQNFLVNPLDFPGAPSQAANFSLARVAPFACSGTVPAAQLDRLYVQPGFPLADLAGALNVRFDAFGATSCDPQTTPPDANVAEFTSARAPAYWMTRAPATPAAEPYTTPGGARVTVADPEPVPPNVKGSSYGTLWAYAPAVRYSASAPGHAGAPFTVRNHWTILYPNTSDKPVAANGYYSDSDPRPGVTTNNINSVDPALHPGLIARRILKVPLLACPVAGSVATVLGIGKFLMTARATSTALYGEFGGLAEPASLGVTFGLMQ